MFLIQKILFNQQECESIIDITKSKKQNWNYKDRIYESTSIEYNKNTIWLFDKLTDFVEKETNIKIGIIKKTIHFHVFLNGSWFDVHNDERENRVYGVGALLNDKFDGGDFKFYDENKELFKKH